MGNAYSTSVIVDIIKKCDNELDRNRFLFINEIVSCSKFIVNIRNMGTYLSEPKT